MWHVDTIINLYPTYNDKLIDDKYIIYVVYLYIQIELP